MKQFGTNYTYDTETIIPTSILFYLGMGNIMHTFCHDGRKSGARNVRAFWNKVAKMETCP